MGKISVETDKVFKISLPGYDVETCTPEQCAIHSGFDYPKVEETMEGYEEITLPDIIYPGTTVLKTITHNYGYKPMALVFIHTIESVFWWEGFESLPFIFSVPVFAWFDMEITDNTVEINFVYDVPPETGPMYAGDGNPAGETVGFKWKVMVND